MYHHAKLFTTKAGPESLFTEEIIPQLKMKFPQMSFSFVEKYELVQPLFNKKKILEEKVFKFLCTPKPLSHLRFS